jgi:hypothetical protein
MSTIVDGLYPRVSLRFARFSVNNLITFLRNLGTMIAKNPAFPTPTPSLAEFADAVKDLDQKAQAALNRGRIEVNARKASRRAMLTLARRLASYVQTNCNSDLNTLLSSGFDAIKSPTPPVIPATPGNPRLGYKRNSSGSLIFRFRGGRNVNNFSVQHSESVDGPWIDHPLSTSTRVEIKQLVPGKMCWARSRANGTAGSSDWTVPTSKMTI